MNFVEPIARIAQSVEQRTENPRVASSNLAPGIKCFVFVIKKLAQIFGFWFSEPRFLYLEAQADTFKLKVLNPKRVFDSQKLK
jgi:hypothetical protein|tara:strand:- start:891 stop:1139 length:249 start_codon:yes stop_codon:yes gene_type:complete